MQKHNSRALLLNSRASVNSGQKKVLAPINAEEIKNKDLLMGGVMSPLAADKITNSFAESDGMQLLAEKQKASVGMPKTSSSSFAIHSAKQSLLPPSLIKTKSSKTRSRALPKIDHDAQREKLQSIISLCENDGQKPVGIERIRGGSVKPNFKPSQNKISADGGKILPRQASTQSVETEAKAGAEKPKVGDRISLVDRQKEVQGQKLVKPTPQVLKQAEPRKRPLKYKSDAITISSKDSKPSQPSKWIMTIIKQNYLYFAQRLDALQVSKRVAALKRMRMEFKRRITLVQLHYRHKKFGEPLPVQQKVQEISDTDSEHAEAEDVWKELGGKDTIARLKRIEEINQKGMLVVDRLLKKKEVEEISDLHSIAEEEDEQQFTSKSAVVNHMQTSVIDNFLKKEIKLIANSIQKVNSFVKMWINRRQYLQKRRAIILIQGQWRVYLAKKVLNQHRIERLDVDRMKRMNIYLRHFKDKAKLNTCAATIQKKLFGKIKQRRMAKELRQKLKALPIVCRAGFVKMEMLKMDSQQLQVSATRIFSAKGRRR